MILLLPGRCFVSFPGRGSPRSCRRLTVSFKQINVCLDHLTAPGSILLWGTADFNRALIPRIEDVPVVATCRLVFDVPEGGHLEMLSLVTIDDCKDAEVIRALTLIQQRLQLFVERQVNI